MIDVSDNSSYCVWSTLIKEMARTYQMDLFNVIKLQCYKLDT